MTHLHANKAHLPRLNTAPAAGRTRLRERGMVTAELAIGILTATLIAVGLCWGLSVVVVHTMCADVAAQVARAEARGDATASDEARGHAPAGASISVDKSGDQVRVAVTTAVRLGHVVAVQVTGMAVMPKEPGT